IGMSLLSGDIPFVGDSTAQSFYGYPAFAQWMSENPKEAEKARTGGYTDPESGQTFTGERAVWERFQADRNLLERTMDSLWTDPLNAVPSMGAPLRGGARLVGNARRGIGYTDEVSEVVAPIIRAGRTAEDVLTSPIVPELAEQASR